MKAVVDPIRDLSDPVLAAALATSIAEQIVDLAVRVFHGDDANYARPAVTNALDWYGTVRPVNMLPNDIWHVTSVQAVEPPINWAIDLDASQITLLDATPVATWPDSSGNSRNATQATSTKRPIFHVAAGSDPAFVRGDGADDYMQTPAMTALAQPFTLVMAFRMTTVTTDGATLKSIVASIASGTNLTTFSQRGSGGAARFEANGGASGQGIITTTTATAGAWVVISVVHNGASTTVRVNGVPATIAGTNPGTNTPTGLTLFSGYSGASVFSDCDIHAVKLAAGTIPNLADVEASLMARCGL